MPPIYDTPPLFPYDDSSRDDDRYCIREFEPDNPYWSRSWPLLTWAQICDHIATAPRDSAKSRYEVERSSAAPFPNLLNWHETLLAKDRCVNLNEIVAVKPAR